MGSKTEKQQKKIETNKGYLVNPASRYSDKGKTRFHVRCCTYLYQRKAKSLHGMTLNVYHSTRYVQIWYVAVGYFRVDANRMRAYVDPLFQRFMLLTEQTLCLIYCTGNAIAQATHRDTHTSSVHFTLRKKKHLPKIRTH